MSEKGYKVVRKTGIGYRGAYVNTYYSLGKWRKAPAELSRLGYGLTYFATLQEAEEYRQFHGLKNRGAVIVTCEVRGVFKHLERRACVKHGDLVRTMVRRIKSGDFSCVGYPPGTKMAEEMRLIEEVS